MSKDAAKRKPLPPEFERPKVAHFSEETIQERRKSYYQVVASFAMEGHEPDDFAKVVSLEAIRGELTEERAEEIICRKIPEETKRIEEKIQRLRETGLSWEDL